MAICITVIVVSLMYISLLTVVYLSKQRINNIENQIYNKIIILDIFCLVLEFFCCLTVSEIINIDILKHIVNKMFLVSILTWVYLFSKYMVAVSLSADNKQLSKLQDKNDFITKGFSIFYCISILLIVVLPLQYFFDGNYIYSYGMAANYVFVATGIYITTSIISIFMNIKQIPRKKVLPMFVFLAFVIMCWIIRIINPGLLLINATTAFVTVLMFFTIENPDLKMVQALEIAKESADKANQSKTEFLSSMSHEIRTPLNAIVGFSDCILDAHTVEEAKENAKDIVNASQTLLEIVNGILDISKIESGKLEIVNTTYNARELFTELATLITPRMKEKGLDFTYEIDSSLPSTLYGDKANLKKIVTNFLSNACKYTDHGFVRYEVHSVRLGDYVRLIISVEDSGRGIKKESIDQLFTRFQRLDEDRNTTIEGTGLGLAITKQLTELMGGKVIVHTVYGEGSKFTAVINQRIESMAEPVQQEVYDSLDLHDVSILIVDDAPLNLKVATKLFERYNANKVETCSSGFECIERIMTGHHYDLLFLDDMMPKMSGIETFEKLKAIPTFKIPTIALTANAISGMREKYLSVGFDDYIAKPIEQNELIRVCNMLLGRKNKEEELPKKEVVEVSEEEIKAIAEKNKIIPVEENIEEVLGDMVDLTRDKKAFTSMISKTEILDAIRDDNDVEVLDFGDSEEKENSVPEIVSVEPVSLLPVVELGMEERAKKEEATTPETKPIEENIPEVKPVEEVEPVSEVDENETYDQSYLTKNGADLDKAMELLGDMEMYNMTVHDFLDEVDDKWRRINDELQQEDMKNYAIDVHSLKSDCKYLGFYGLADIAYDHELKSKDNQLEYCKEHFKELEEEYYRVIDVIRNYADHNPVSE